MQRPKLLPRGKKAFKILLFLAVQDSSITDIVCRSVGQSQLTTITTMTKMTTMTTMTKMTTMKTMTKMTTKATTTTETVI